MKEIQDNKQSDTDGVIATLRTIRSKFDTEPELLKAVSSAGKKPSTQDIPPKKYAGKDLAGGEERDDQASYYDEMLGARKGVTAKKEFLWPDTSQNGAVGILATIQAIRSKLEEEPLVAEAVAYAQFFPTNDNGQDLPMKQNHEELAEGGRVHTEESVLNHEISSKRGKRRVSRGKKAAVLGLLSRFRKVGQDSKASLCEEGNISKEPTYEINNDATSRPSDVISKKEEELVTGFSGANQDEHQDTEMKKQAQTGRPVQSEDVSEGNEETIGFQNGQEHTVRAHRSRKREGTQDRHDSSKKGGIIHILRRRMSSKRHAGYSSLSVETSSTASPVAPSSAIYGEEEQRRHTNAASDYRQDGGREDSSDRESPDSSAQSLGRDDATEHGVAYQDNSATVHAAISGEEYAGTTLTLDQEHTLAVEIASPNSTILNQQEISGQVHTLAVEIASPNSTILNQQEISGQEHIGIIATHSLNKDTVAVVSGQENDGETTTTLNRQEFSGEESNVEPTEISDQERHQRKRSLAIQRLRAKFAGRKRPGKTKRTHDEDISANMARILAVGDVPPSLRGDASGSDSINSGGGSQAFVADGGGSLYSEDGSQALVADKVGELMRDHGDLSNVQIPSYVTDELPGDHDDLSTQSNVPNMQVPSYESYAEEGPPEEASLGGSQALFPFGLDGLPRDDYGISSESKNRGVLIPSYDRRAFEENQFDEASASVSSDAFSSRQVTHARRTRRTRKKKARKVSRKHKDTSVGGCLDPISEALEDMMCCEPLAAMQESFSLSSDDSYRSEIATPTFSSSVSSTSSYR
jgi:hypothetical protein